MVVNTNAIGQVECKQVVKCNATTCFSIPFAISEFGHLLCPFWIVVLYPTCSEWICATLNTRKSDFRGFPLPLPPELIKQPLVGAFLAVSHEQKRPSDSE
jgi:hypothetical protein